MLVPKWLHIRLRHIPVGIITQNNIRPSVIVYIRNTHIHPAAIFTYRYRMGFEVHWLILFKINKAFWRVAFEISKECDGSYINIAIAFKIGSNSLCTPIDWIKIGLFKFPIAQVSKNIQAMIWLQDA